MLWNRPLARSASRVAEQARALETAPHANAPYGKTGRTRGDSLRRDFGQKKRRKDRHGKRMPWRSGEGRMRREASERRSYEGIGNSRDLSKRRMVRFLRASLICA